MIGKNSKFIHKTFCPNELDELIIIDSNLSLKSFIPNMLLGLLY